MLFSTGLPRKHGEFSISRGQATPKRNLTPMAAGLSCSAAIAWRGSRSPRRGKANRGGSGRPGRARTARFRLHRHPDRCGWRTGRAHPHRAARPRPAFRPRVIWPGVGASHLSAASRPISSTGCSALNARATAPICRRRVAAKARLVLMHRGKITPGNQCGNGESRIRLVTDGETVSALRVKTDRAAQAVAYAARQSE